MTEPNEDENQNDANSSLNSGVPREEEAVVVGDPSDGMKSSRIDLGCSALEKERGTDSLAKNNTSLEKHAECKTLSCEHARANSDEIHSRHEAETETSSVDTHTNPQGVVEINVTHDTDIPDLRNDHENSNGIIVNELSESTVTSNIENNDEDVRTVNVSADVVEASFVSEKLDHGNDIAGTSEINTAQNENPRKNVLERESSNSLLSNLESDNQKRLSAVAPSFMTAPKSDIIRSITSEGRNVTVTSTARKKRRTLKRHSSDTEVKTLHGARREEKSSFPRRDDAVSKFIAVKHLKAPFTPPSKGSNADLLSSFITYKDQIPSTPSSQKSSLRDEKHRSLSEGPRPFTAPSNIHINSQVEKRPPELEKRKIAADKSESKGGDQELLKSTDPCKSYNQEDYEIPPCLIKTRNILFSPKTPESQKTAVDGQRPESGLNRTLSIRDDKTEKRFSRTVHSNQISGHSDLQRMVTSSLGSAVKLCCSLCIIARCLTFTGAKKSLLYYIIESPAVWAVRFYILVFHAIMILVEMKIGIPGILPRGTLRNFVHRAFIQSFVGLLDICMNSNKSLVERVSDGAASNEIENWIEISYAVLRVAPRGLIACAISYFMLAVCGINGGSNFSRRSTLNDAPIDLNV